ncbi:MAG TPA: pyroglutamyl-peptidase I [Tissierellia bacterium]|nr:pyroglutamyl-peptidase I [Tissierellia bacterium]
MKVLVTGFEPFGGERVNPSIEAVKRLSDKIAGADIIKAEIPTVFNKSIRKLEKILEDEKPDITICVGQAGGRNRISVERVAINISDGRIPDNEGYQPVDEIIFEDGDTAYFARLPIKKIVKELNDRNIPAEVSNTAGTYVCNHLMYGLLYNINKKYPNMMGGFIHIPFLPEQVIDKPNMPCMSLDLIVEGLTIAIEVAVNSGQSK